MGAKQSEAMTEALKLITLSGVSQAEAARRVGLTKGAISKNRHYRQWKEQQNAREDKKPD